MTALVILALMMIFSLAIVPAAIETGFCPICRSWKTWGQGVLCDCVMKPIFDRARKLREIRKQKENKS